MFHVYVTPVEDKKEMKSYGSLFLREFLKFKGGVPNLRKSKKLSMNCCLLTSDTLDASHQTQTTGNTNDSFCITYT